MTRRNPIGREPHLGSGHGEARRRQDAPFDEGRRRQDDLDAAFFLSSPQLQAVHRAGLPPGGESPEGDVYMVDNPNRRCPDISKARREIGYEPAFDLEEGLRRTLIWYNENRWGEAR